MSIAKIVVLIFELLIFSTTGLLSLQAQPWTRGSVALGRSPQGRESFAAGSSGFVQVGEFWVVHKHVSGASAEPQNRFRRGEE